MKYRNLGDTGMKVSPVGFGALKIGRNQKTKYPQPYDLPNDAEVEKLLNGIIDLGINYIDTAPAYGTSEDLIGRYLSHRRDELILSTKVGELFEDGNSQFDYSKESVQSCLKNSLKKLKTDWIDIVLIHSDGSDRDIIQKTDAVRELASFRDAGHARAIGISAKTTEGVLESFEWADVFMLEYHLENRTMESVIEKAFNKGKGIVIKKGLSSGNLSPEEAIHFVLQNKCISSMVTGSLNLDHIRENVFFSEQVS